MGKIIKLKSKQENVIEFLEDAIVQARKYNVDNVLIAFKLNQNSKSDELEDIPHIMTGYCHLDMCEKQELLGHIQVDIINDMIMQNYSN